MKDDVKILFSKGYLLEPQLANSISNEPFDMIPLTETLTSMKPPKLITKNFFENNINAIIEKLVEKEVEKEILDRIRGMYSGFLVKEPQDEKKEEAKEHDAKTEFDKKRNVTIIETPETPIKEINVIDFVEYFRNRYHLLKSLLQERELEGLSSIGKISGQRRVVSVIGMVADKRQTKNKNIILELEDLTGRVNVMVHHDKQELFEKANQTVLDEVIAVKGSGSNEIIFANDIIFPDIVLKEKKKSSMEHYALFTSDLHVGSDKFLEDNLLKFISWLNCETGSVKQKEIAKKVRYLFIVGDTVDGVGVYPRQEREINIKDVKEQYKRLAELLGMIRKDVTIIMCPGGKHDAVRQVEPQPRIPKDIAPGLYNMENLVLVTNPAIVRIEQSRGS